MNYIDYILESNLTAVVIGGLISLGSVYFVEYLKERKSWKHSRLKIYAEIKTALIEFEYYADFVMQFDALFAYHKRLSEIWKDDFHVEEGQRRQLQMEEYQTKTVEIECQLEQLAAQYHFFFGEDKKFDDLLEKIRNWPALPYVDYTYITDLNVLNKKRKDDMHSGSEQIKATLGKSILEFNHYLNLKTTEIF